MNNKESRHLVVLDSTKRKGILLDILEFCEKIVKESWRLSVEKNGLLNALYGSKEYWKELEACAGIDERHLVIDPQRESMEFFYEFGRFCEKEKMQCIFQDEWLQPDTGRGEKSDLGMQKTDGSVWTSSTFPDCPGSGCLKLL